MNSNIISKLMKNEKDKQVIMNIFGAFAIKGGALLISLFTMPAYIRYFDNQIVLGLWFTVLSVMIWILSFDFGIGNGLRNKLVIPIVEDNKREIKTYISSAYIINLGIVVLTILLGVFLSQFIDWNLFFNIDKNIISEATMLFTVRCIFVGVMLQFLLRLISSILYAMQKSAITNLIALVTSIMQLGFILLVPTFDIETNLRMLSLAYVAFINIPLIVASIIVFKTELKSCAPSLKFFDKAKSVSVLSLGGIFFWNQIMYMVITITNDFFITQLSGLEFVVEYQIYNKLFTLVGSLFMIALTPLWSAITKAIAEKDSVWLRKIYRKLNYMTILAIGFQFLMIPLLQFLINIWLGSKAITVNYIYAIAFSLYGSVFIYQSVLSTIACGMGKIKLQAYCYTFAVVFKFIMVYYGMMIYDSWIVVIFANFLILLPYCILQPRYISKEIYNLKSGGQ